MINKLLKVLPFSLMLEEREDNRELEATVNRIIENAGVKEEKVVEETSNNEEKSGAEEPNPFKNLFVREYDTYESFNERNNKIAMLGLVMSIIALVNRVTYHMYISIEASNAIGNDDFKIALQAVHSTIFILASLVALVPLFSTVVVASLPNMLDGDDYQEKLYKNLIKITSILVISLLCTTAPIYGIVDNLTKDQLLDVNYIQAVCCSTFFNLASNLTIIVTSVFFNRSK